MSGANYDTENATGKDKGAVLLVTILVMSLMATLAVATIDVVRSGVYRASHQQAYAQADWYAKAAEDFAQTYISTQFIDKKQDALKAVIKDPQIISFPIEGGLINMQLRDGGQCLSLGRLGNAPVQRQLTNLMVNLGLDAVTAETLAVSAGDWADADTQISPQGAEDYTYMAISDLPHRTANTDFSSVMELRAVKGMTEAAYQLVRPYVCSRPSSQPSNISVNSLNAQHVPILAAMLGEDKMELAQSIIDNRPSSGYKSAEDLQQSIAVRGDGLTGVNLGSLTYESEYIWIEAEITFQSATRFMVTEYKIDANKAVKVFHSYNEEARRPMLESQTQ